MNKRPALLAEACKIVQDAKQNGWHKWMARGASVWLSSDYQAAAIPQGHHVNRMLIIGTTEFDTTEFVGRELFDIISHRRAMPEEEQRLALLCFTPQLRILRHERNGHQIWRVVLVESRKGKEEIMD